MKSISILEILDFHLRPVTAFRLAFLPFVPLQKATAPHNMLIMGIKLPILAYLLVLENENEVNL